MRVDLLDMRGRMSSSRFYTWCVPALANAGESGSTRHGISSTSRQQASSMHAQCKAAQRPTVDSAWPPLKKGSEKASAIVRFIASLMDLSWEKGSRKKGLSNGSLEPDPLPKGSQKNGSLRNGFMPATCVLAAPQYTNVVEVLLKKTPEVEVWTSVIPRRGSELTGSGLCRFVKIKGLTSSTTTDAHHPKNTLTLSGVKKNSHMRTH